MKLVAQNGKIIKSSAPVTLKCIEELLHLAYNSTVIPIYQRSSTLICNKDEYESFTIQLFKNLDEGKSPTDDDILKRKKLVENYSNITCYVPTIGELKLELISDTIIE